MCVLQSWQLQLPAAHLLERRLPVGRPKLSGMKIYKSYRTERKMDFWGRKFHAEWGTCPH